MISTFKAKLNIKEQLTADVLRLSFQVPKQFSFKAGQFVSLQLKQGEVQHPRSYSILNPPSEPEKLDLCVKIVETGFASNVFKQMKNGDELAVKGPLGHFMLDEQTDNEHWFIGAGTGITPLHSLIKEHLPNFPSKKFCLLIGYKNVQDLLFHEEFLKMKARYENFSYIPIISRGAWDGKIGHVQDYLGEDLQNKTFYICGLKDLVLETAGLLLNRGVEPKNIKFERYN